MLVCRLGGTTVARELSICFIRQHSDEIEGTRERTVLCINLGAREEVSVSHTGHLPRRPEAPIATGQETVWELKLVWTLWS